jgi:hypothetical protein
LIFLDASRISKNVVWHAFLHDFVAAAYMVTGFAVVPSLGRPKRYKAAAESLHKAIMQHAVGTEPNGAALQEAAMQAAALLASKPRRRASGWIKGWRLGCIVWLWVSFAVTFIAFDTGFGSPPSPFGVRALCLFVLLPIGGFLCDGVAGTYAFISDAVESYERAPSADDDVLKDAEEKAWSALRKKRFWRREAWK